MACDAPRARARVVQRAEQRLEDVDAREVGGVHLTPWLRGARTLAAGRHGDDGARANARDGMRRRSGSRATVGRERALHWSALGTVDVTF